MAQPISNKGAKWVEQVPSHIKQWFEESGNDYKLEDVINVCEEIINLYDNGIDTKNEWNGKAVPELMMSTVSFRNKYKRYL